MTIEREAKLAASDDFVLPAFADVVEGVVAGAPRLRRLHAIYFDTDDLVLARAGITLRHRTGEAGDRWTLKLSGEASGSELSRHELTFPGPPHRIPPEAVDLVRVHAHGRRLNAVARLRTARTTVELSRDGSPVAEVADDRVSAYVGSQRVARFREIEVELLGSDDVDGGDELIEATVGLLCAAGATAGSPVSKLVQALGPAAAMPPDVVVGAVDRHSDAREFVRHVIAFSTARLLEKDPLLRLGPEDEDVHAFRVATRRLRSDLRTFHRLLDPDWVESLRTELKWLADAVGGARDVDVLEARLRAHAAALDDRDAADAETLLTTLADERERAHEQLSAAMRTDRYDALMAALVAASTKPAFAGPADVDVNARPIVTAAVRRSWKRLRKEVDRAGKHPSDEELHSIRIIAKRARYAAEAAGRVVGKKADRLAAAIADLQDVLGDHHDASVAEAWLRSAGEGGRGGIAAGLLIARQQREREELARDWRKTWKKASRKKLRKWL